MRMVLSLCCFASLFLVFTVCLCFTFTKSVMAILVLRPSTVCVHRHAVNPINRSDYNRSMYTHWMQSQILEQFSPVISSDEDVNILTICFCLIFISSGSGCFGFTFIEIDRSINRSVAIIAPYALTTKSDLELFSPVTSSDEDISIFSEATTVHISSLKGHCG